MEVSNTGYPVPRSCRMCGKPEHGSLACSCAPGWPLAPHQISPEAQVISDMASDVKVIQGQLVEYNVIRSQLEKEKWMKEAAMRDAIAGGGIPFTWEDYEDMLSDLYESEHKEG